MNNFKINDLSTGMSYTFNHVFSKGSISNFIELSGDNNPLHSSYNYAKNNGFKDCVVHGVLSSGLYSKLIGLYLPGQFSLLHRIDVTFSRPIYEEDYLTVTGEIVNIHLSVNQIEIKSNIKSNNKDVLSRAKIWVGFHG